jgi:DNA-3-methyladenine glycosylase I
LGQSPIDNATTSGLQRSNDEPARCWWCGTDAAYVAYHDQEWGRPVHDDHRLFEKICLEGFQAGLSWLTILRKREAFREAFAGFDFSEVAKFSQRQIAQLVRNERIVRHRGKIESTVDNARRALLLAEEFGSLDTYFWSFQPEPGPPPQTPAELPAKTPASTRLSRDLKNRGWSFVGPTTCYAFMQAMGMVNDHLSGCFVRAELEQGG